MSEENVEIVRASLNALDEGDAETALSYFAEDVVFQPLVAGPYHGHAGVVEQWLTWMDEFDGYWFESEELIDAGDDLVVMLWRQGGEGKSSGIKVENRGATVFTVGDGVIRHARVFGERSEALEAAGLRGSAMSQENVEVVRRAIAAVNDRDVDAYLALCAPDIELVTPVAPIEGASVGEEGIRQFFSGLDEAAAVFRFEVDALQAVREDRVVAFLRLVFESKGGVALPQRLTNVYDLSGGKLARIRVYLDRAEALEAAGLSE